MRQLFEFYALFVKFVQKLSFIFAFAFPANLFVLFTRVHAFSYGYAAFLPHRIQSLAKTQGKTVCTRVSGGMLQGDGACVCGRAQVELGLGARA